MRIVCTCAASAEARLDIAQRREGADHQQRADQQHQRHGHLRHHQHVARALPRRGSRWPCGSAPASAAERLRTRILAAPESSRRTAPRTPKAASVKPSDAAIERDFAQARQVGRADRRQQAQARHTQRRSRARRPAGPAPRSPAAARAQCVRGRLPARRGSTAPAGAPPRAPAADWPRWCRQSASPARSSPSPPTARCPRCRSPAVSAGGNAGVILQISVDSADWCPARSTRSPSTPESAARCRRRPAPAELRA